MHLQPRRRRPIAPSRRLRMETLERRVALDSQGVMVGIDPHFTLSFLPDGGAVGESASVLHATFDQLASRALWREAILRGFQTWAVHTNADIAVVSDGGQPLGTPGPRQHDSRFGDIRVAAVPLLPEVGAVSVPVGNVASGSWLADVVFNTSFNYQTVSDLLAVATHEAGNVFGLKDSDDPNSPLHAGVAPVVLPPTAADIVNLQSLHGARAPDKNEAHRTVLGARVDDNNTPANATPLSNAAATGLEHGTAPTIVFGDIGSTDDLDYFTFTTPDDYSGPLTIQLRTSGVSLLRPSVMLLDPQGVVVSQASSNSTVGSVLTMQLLEVAPGETFTLRVAGAVADVFGIGGYSVAITYDGLNVVDAATLNKVLGGANRSLTAEDLSKLFDDEERDYFNEDDGADETLATATELNTTEGFADNSRYDTIGSIISSTEADNYSVKSPSGGGTGTLDVMTVAVRSFDAGRLVPGIQVLDEDGAVLPTTTIVNGAGQVLLQLEGVQPGKDYFVRVGAADPAGPFVDGNYDLTVTFVAEPATLSTVAAGAVGGAIGKTTHTLYVGRPQLFHFALATTGPTTGGPVAVVTLVKNEQGVVVAKLASRPGETRSAPAVLLNAGAYTVEFLAIGMNGAVPTSLGYELRAQVLSDPFVGDPSDPNNHPFACPEPELAGQFCYPGGFLSPDPFLWDDFIQSVPQAPQLPLDELVNLLLGDWWSWVWEQIGINGPTLAQNDRFDFLALGAPHGTAPATPNVLRNDIDPEGGAFVAVLVSGAEHGTLTLSPDGNVLYTPNTGFVGVDRFTYTAYDFVQDSTVATAYLVVGSGRPGDYNGDGSVDLLDGAVWRQSFGSTVNLLADGNKDLVVDAADYTVWRDAFSAPPAATASEPARGLAEPVPATTQVALSVAAPAALPAIAQRALAVATPRSLALQTPQASSAVARARDSALHLLYSAKAARAPEHSVWAEVAFKSAGSDSPARSGAAEGGGPLANRVRSSWRSLL